MLNYNLKIGVLTVRRLITEPPKRIGIFQSDYAIENKRIALDYLRNNYENESTRFVDIEWLNEEGLLRRPEDCAAVVEHFKREGINALFIVNCNFGEERVQKSLFGSGRRARLPRPGSPGGRQGRICRSEVCRLRPCGLPHNRRARKRVHGEGRSGSQREGERKSAESPRQKRGAGNLEAFFPPPPGAGGALLRIV